MSPVAIVFWVLAAGSIVLPESAAIYLFVCSTPFGALSLLPEGVGGFNLLPYSVAALALAARAWLIKDVRAAQISGLIRWRGFALFALFVVYGLFTAIVFPRIFQGQVEVIALDTALPASLEPTSANINQSAYLFADLVSALALFGILKCDRSGKAREHLIRAFMIGGILLIATGLLEVSGLAPDFVALFRNAKYSNFGDGEIESVHRITGFFSEASAYGPKCVVFGAYLFFVRSACRSAFWRKALCPIVSLVLVGMGALSTSSTAFICIFLFLALLAGRIGFEIYRRQPFREYALELVVLIGGGLILLLCWMAEPDLLVVPLKLLDTLVLRKSESGSFMERTMWNHIGKLAFLATSGLGVGVGGARTSDWAISVLSNTGVVGVLLMGGFVALVFLQRPTRMNPRWAISAEAGKYAFAVFLIGACASGATIDPGVIFSILVAAIGAGSAWSDPIGAASRRRRPAASAVGPGSGREARGRSEAAADPVEPHAAFGSSQT